MKTTYIVYIEQVNQAAVEVDAKNRDEAIEKACRKWRREDAQPNVMSVAEVETRKAES